MIYRALLTISAVLVLIFSVNAQEQQEESTPPGPPQPLNDSWHQWMIGEWKGTSESNMGKTKDWMKVEWGPGKQFLIMHYKGKTTEVKEDALKQAAKKMNMPQDKMKEMMMEDYYGIGIMTLNPQTGEPMGYWFDSYRDISKGSGTMEDGKSTMTWTSKAMGTMKRVVKKVNEEKMTIKMHGQDPSGMEWSGSSVMQRVK
ncbi:MAG: hypothetical protein GF313_16620 [Caldithrix sp.]|nr:hypothetical protein [Caldithrix sp.]